MKRKGIVFGFTTAAVVMVVASTAFACVTFMGSMTVDGHDGDTTVVGTGNSHAYCSTGRPTTAAAGHLADSITATVSPGTCADPGALASHKLPRGSYEVRYNNANSYTFDGTFWVMTAGTGCFRAANAATTTTIGSFNVDKNGNGSWTGTLGDPAGTDYFPGPLNAANFCVGDPQGPVGDGGFPGMLAPYRLLQV